MGDRAVTVTLGSCSLCGGRVTVPKNWMATVPPVPTCERCGARKKAPHGSVVEMERPVVPQPLQDGGTEWACRQCGKDVIFDCRCPRPFRHNDANGGPVYGDY